MSTDSLAHRFQKRFGLPPAVMVRAPGRINLLGAHVDYHEGWVLPAAIDRAVLLAAAPARGTVSRLVAADLGEEARLDHRRLAPPVPERPAGVARWWDLPGGLLQVLALEGREAAPVDAYFTSSVPMGAGVSSSAAVEMAFLLAWEAISGFRLDDAARARLGERVENLYLGVGSGPMDQLASLLGREGHLLLIDCRTLAAEPVPLPAGLGFLIADSGIRRRLAETSFSDRRVECGQALERLRQVLPELRTLRDLAPEAFEEHGRLLTSTERRRVRHVIEECTRVRAGARALREGDLAAFAREVCRSHRSSRDLYQVSLPELDLLAETAWEHSACHGARLLGGGFGGSVGALVEVGREEELALALETAYRRRFGRPAPTFTSCAAHGARLLQDS